MITMEECIALSGLTAEEVGAIAEHEHIPEAAAMALAGYLMADEATGPRRIVAMIRDDIRLAIARKDRAHARALVAALCHFLREHPMARPVRDEISRPS